MPSDLPINAVLPSLINAFRENDDVILEAEPGAGKTTVVPLALLNSDWLEENIILMLEPRRVAARAAAERMAATLGEAVGETIGYQVRHEKKYSSKTKVLVVTEGILARKLQADPSLDGIGLVIFDEFHERNLDSDLALAFCLQSRDYFRETTPLKLLVMSATLDSLALAKCLPNAPTIKSAGRSFPVELKYSDDLTLFHNSTLNNQSKNSRNEFVCHAIQHMLNTHNGSMLVFLPGRGEISAIHEQLQTFIDEDISVLPLHGSLSLAEQRRAISSKDDVDVRKVVLATDIAETSLTIDNITIVVDTGLARKPEFDPKAAMTRLATKRISLASATQRAGRAGRLGPGVALRLWPKHEETQFEKHSVPEIRSTDLTQFALQLFCWGAYDPAELQLVDQPQSSAFHQARDLLIQLEAISIIDGRVQLTELGRLMGLVPAHPRIANMLLQSVRIKHARLGAIIASICGEQDPFRDWSASIIERIELFIESKPCPNFAKAWKQRVEKQIQQFKSLVNSFDLPDSFVKRSSEHISTDITDTIGFLLACAFPDRIAKQTTRGSYKLANGRQATLEDTDRLQNERWLVISDLGGRAGSQTDRIYSAAPFSITTLEDQFNHATSISHNICWNKADKRFQAEQQHTIGKLVFKSKPVNDISSEARTEAIARYIQQENLSPLNWDKTASQLCARIELLKKVDNEGAWPDFSRETLRKTVVTWLGPYLAPVNTASDLAKLKLNDILRNSLDWEQQKRLDQLAPLSFKAPSGSNISIDYSQSSPALSVKLQEMFGCNQTPSILNGKVPLSIHLLSPAQRPLQITQDLEHFWQTSYHEIKKEMKGRYPKHPWPDDPVSAEATRFTKSRIAKK